MAQPLPLRPAHDLLVVVERPRGSSTCTLAHNDQGFVFISHNLSSATNFARSVRRHMRGANGEPMDAWVAHVVAEEWIE